MNKMTLKEARIYAGLSRPQVYHLFGVPVRTQENWEAGVRAVPEYIEQLLVQQLLQVKNVVRIKITDSEVVVEKQENGKWVIHASGTVRDGQIPLKILQEIAVFQSRGYRLIFE